MKPGSRIGPRPLVVRELGASDHAAWDRFVLDHPHGSPFHLIAWKESIEATFGYQPKYLVAVTGDQVCGVLPLFLVSNMLTGKRLISSPFAVYGGILADSDETRQALLNQATGAGGEVGGAGPGTQERLGRASAAAGCRESSRYLTFTKEIEGRMKICVVLEVDSAENPEPPCVRR